jgi:phosphoenolpyruvate carboxylase
VRVDDALGARSARNHHIWQTEEHPREKLTVADEREHVLFYLIDILYRVVPHFYEEIEAALAAAFEVPRESLDLPNILRFGSWVGGDMEGNTEVHGKAIRETLQRHRQVIVSTYFAECRQLAESLSQSANRVAITQALAERIDAYTAMLPAALALRRRATIACRTGSSSARSASDSRRPTRRGRTGMPVRRNCSPTSNLASTA